MHERTSKPTRQGGSLQIISDVGGQMKNLMARFVREEEGQDLIEYSLLCALIAVASIAAMNLLGGSISAIFGRVQAALDAAPNN
jgi:pilus assembly protein Flp/PilA